jgi:hypothetical protein
VAVGVGPPAQVNATFKPDVRPPVLHSN